MFFYSRVFRVFYYSLGSRGVAIGGGVPIVSIATIASYRYRVSLVVAFVLLVRRGLYVLFQGVVTFRGIIGTGVVEYVGGYSRRLSSFYVFRGVVYEPSCSCTNFFLDRLPSGLLLCVGNTIYRVHVFKGKASRVALYAFAYSNSTFLCSIRGIYESTCLFSGLVRGVAVVGLGPRVLYGLLASNVTLNSVFTTGHGCRVFRTLPSRARVFVEFSCRGETRRCGS